MQFKSDRQRKAVFSRLSHSGSLEFSKVVPYHDRYKKQLRQMGDEATRNYRQGKCGFGEYRTCIPAANNIGSIADTGDIRPRSSVITDDTGKKVIGIMTYLPMGCEQHEEDNSLFMRGLYIRPDERGKGHGSDAVRKLFENNPEIPYVKLRTMPLAENSRSAGFWAKLGAENEENEGNEYPLHKLDRDAVLKKSKFSNDPKYELSDSAARFLFYRALEKENIDPDSLSDELKDDFVEGMHKDFRDEGGIINMDDDAVNKVYLMQTTFDVVGKGLKKPEHMSVKFFNALQKSNPRKLIQKDEELITESDFNNVVKPSDRIIYSPFEMEQLTRAAVMDANSKEHLYNLLKEFGFKNRGRELK